MPSSWERANVSSESLPKEKGITARVQLLRLTFLNLAKRGRPLNSVLNWLLYSFFIKLLMVVLFPSTRTVSGNEFKSPFKKNGSVTGGGKSYCSLFPSTKERCLVKK